MRYGANLSAETKNGSTVLDIAERGGKSATSKITNGLNMNLIGIEKIFFTLFAMNFRICIRKNDFSFINYSFTHGIRVGFFGTM